MRALSRVLALILLVSGLASAQGVPGALAPCHMSGSDCAPATGTVTTTGTLAAGQVALGSGATSITGDAGATYAGSAGTTKFTIGGITFGGSAAGGTGLYLSAANTLGFTTNGTERWVMNASGALNPTIDATYDIGTSLVRPRDIDISRTGTFGTSVVTPLVSGGADSATPNATVVTGTGSRGGTDTNVAGGNLTIRPGAGTGSATGSSIIFQTPTAGASGTTAQTQATRLTISETNVNVVGALGVGVASPVGAGFALETSGGIYAYAGSIRSDDAGPLAFYAPSGGGVFGGPVRLKGYTVATLPAGTVGDTAYVTDATAPTYLGTLTGGGAVTCPVMYNGSAWVSH